LGFFEKGRDFGVLVEGEEKLALSELAW
jgi:hypothetical protein